LPTEQSANRARSKLASRRLHVRLPATTAADLLARAAAGGLSVSAVARQLIQLGLDDSSGPASEDFRLLALCALVAAEHTALMVAAVLPDGRRLMVELGVEAAAAAEQRLAMLKDAER
jgi:plasmid stability protein